MTINRTKKLIFKGTIISEDKESDKIVISKAVLNYNKERIDLSLETEPLTTEVLVLLENAYLEGEEFFEVKLNYVQLRHLLKIMKTNILYLYREEKLDHFDGEGSVEKDVYDRIRHLKESLEKK